MRVCIVGAGAIGGMLGVRLAGAGAEVTLVCRGANLAAARAQGFRLVETDGNTLPMAPARATDRLAEAGRHDLVVLAMKAHQVAAVAPEVNGLCAEEAVIVTMQNGIPWWYFHKLSGPFRGTSVEAVDPGGEIARQIDVDRVLGCVVYPAAEMVSPGVIRHVEGNRLPVGELDGAQTPRAARVSELFRRAGFKSPVLTDIRSEIWLKLWGNLAFNPISALGHATLAGICRFPLSRQLAADMMSEAKEVGEKLGAEFRVSLERRIAGAEGVGEHKTSMLQDVEHGRSLELDAILGAVVELGRLTATPTPHINAVYACVSLLGRSLQERGGRLKIEPLAPS